MIVESSQMHCFSADGAGSPPNCAFVQGKLVVLLRLYVVNCIMPSRVVSSTTLPVLLSV